MCPGAVLLLLLLGAERAVDPFFPLLLVEPPAELVLVLVVDDIVDDDVDLAGAEPPFPGAEFAAKAGEIATSPTMPAANGNRNLRCTAASSPCTTFTNIDQNSHI